MLVNLTINKEVVDKMKEIARDMNFDYTPQSDPRLLLETGIYQMRGFNFMKQEFNENIKDYGLNDHLYTPGKGFSENYQEDYIQEYGVADSIEQIKKLYEKQINDPNKKYIITVTRVDQEIKNKGKGGGWRWHKWGKYIGNLDPQYEYLDDEDFGPNFQGYVIVFSINLIE